MAAHALWRNYPGEIAADLRREYGIDIDDWHQGRLRSLRLLELLEHSDDDGALKKALRQGEPSQHRKAVLQIANELAVLRAVYTEVDGEQWESQLFYTDAKLRRMTEDAVAVVGGREAVFAIGAVE